MSKAHRFDTVVLGAGGRLSPWRTAVVVGCLRVRVSMSSAGRRMRNSAGYSSLVIVYDAYTIDELLRVPIFS